MIIYNDVKIPMSYDEFEKRVIELFLGDNPPESYVTVAKNIVEKTDDIRDLYDEACHKYMGRRIIYEDGEEIIIKPSKNVFNDEELLHQPVRILEMLYGGV